MRNEETMTMEMKRLEICDLLIATTHIVIEARAELADEETTETRKEVLAGTIKKWKRLHDEIARQIAAFDTEYDRRQNQ